MHTSVSTDSQGPADVPELHMPVSALGRADLGRTDVGMADLGEADLGGAGLGRADLEGAGLGRVVCSRSKDKA